jgi:LigXa C-terminal domain like
VSEAGTAHAHHDVRRPITVLIPPSNVYSLANLNMPMDDTHTMCHLIGRGHWGSGIDQEAFRNVGHARVGLDLATFGLGIAEA